MAAGSKSAEIRAGVVVLVGLVILGLGLFLVSGGWSRFEAKNRLTVHFKDAGTIGNGAAVFLAGRRVGEVKSLEPVPFTHDGERGSWIAVTIEVAKHAEIPVDSTFQISKSITNLVAFNITPGKNPKLANKDTEGLIGERLATTDEAVDRYTKLATKVGGAVDRADELLKEISVKVKQIDVEGLQGEARQLLTEMRALVADVHAAVRDNRAPVDSAIRNIDDITTRFKDDWATMNGKVQGILDDLGAIAADVKGIVKENREGVKSIVQSLDDGMRRVGPVLAQIEAISRSANDAVIEMRPDLNRALAAASKAFENFESLTEDLKAAPWKLINKPSGKESDDVHLYNAARLYVDAAGSVADAIQDLETLRRLGVLGDAQRADLLEKTLASMQEALAEFEANQKRFTNLIEATSEGGK